MALRKILTQGDEQLLKRSRKVEKFDARLHTATGYNDISLFYLYHLGCSFFHSLKQCGTHFFGG